MIGPAIHKQNTNFIKPISVQDGLDILLRVLAEFHLRDLSFPNYLFILDRLGTKIMA